MASQRTCSIRKSQYAVSMQGKMKRERASITCIMYSFRYRLHHRCFFNAKNMSGTIIWTRCNFAWARSGLYDIVHGAEITASRGGIRLCRDTADLMHKLIFRTSRPCTSLSIFDARFVWCLRNPLSLARRAGWGPHAYLSDLWRLHSLAVEGCVYGLLR